MSDASQDGSNDPNKLPGGGSAGRIGRAALQALGGAVPLAGGLLSAAAGWWGEREQERVNEFLRAFVSMLQDELREKHQTILEITARLDMHDDEIAKRVRSEEYQSLLKKAFRQWAGAESAKKREYIRNILSHAGSSRIVSDDVVSLFIDWLHLYSEFHFAVIGWVYRHKGATRGSIWRGLGREAAREDSAEADLFKLLFRDLSTGGVIRQHRETDYLGRFLSKPAARRERGDSGPKPIKSAFDDEEQYELTALGEQFVHYAMSDVPLKIAHAPQVDASNVDQSSTH
jgi:hypothetical protein